MDVGDNESVIVVSVEDSGVVNRLCHSLHGEEVLVVCCLPDAACVSAACHVASDLEVAGVAIFVMCGKVAEVFEPRRDAGEDEAAAVSD